MATKAEEIEVPAEIPTFVLNLVDKKGSAVTKHVAMRKVLAAEFIVPIVSGDIENIDVAEIVRWRDALVKVCKAYDDAVEKLSEDDRAELPDVYEAKKGQKTFRKPRTDKVSVSVDAEDLLG